jgi:hypothetical protein
MTTADGELVSTTKIVDNGPASLLWNLVILGDGYQTAQMNQYENDVQRVVDAMFRTPPFDELRQAINVYRVNVTSTDSGADDPLTMSCGGSGTTARTYFDATYCGDGRAQRILYVNNTTVLNTVRAQVPGWEGPPDVALVEVNSLIDGGASRDGVTTASRTPDLEEAALHEIGHGAFSLADEYESFLGCASGETGRNNHPATDPAQVNVTTNTDRATLKWRRFVAAATPVPTTKNDICTRCDPQGSPVTAGTIGLFEGANTYHCGAYRPEFTCKMRVLGNPFCAVCRQKIRTDLAARLPEAVEGLEDKIVLGDTSDEGPTLASHGGRLFLAWKGSGNEQLNMMFSEDNGATFRGKMVFGDTSDLGPALVSHGRRLFLAWKGSGNENLNVAKVRLTLLANILWSQRVITSVPGEVPQENPQWAVGKPDGSVYVLKPGIVSGEEKGATFGEFGGGFYPKLAQLLGARPPVTHGDTVSPENLARADVVAFARNGIAPATGGGWEDCDFTFADGVSSLSVSWNGTLGAPRDPHIVANGSVSGSDYKSYFGLASGAVPDGEVISFLLFTLPELNTDAPNFTVAVRGQPSGNVVRTLDDFITGPDSFCVEPGTITTRFQEGAMAGGVRRTIVENVPVPPPGTDTCLNVGSADRLNLELGANTAASLYVTYGTGPDGLHPLRINLNEGGTRSIRVTIAPLAGTSITPGSINFNVEIFTPAGYSALGYNVGAGQIDFEFDKFISGGAGQDFRDVYYIYFLFYTIDSFRLERIETVTGGVPNEPNIDAIGLVRCAGV